MLSLSKHEVFLNPKVPRLLVIAGSDSSAGAGMQADLKTAFAFGVYAQTAVTAVTVQNTRGVAALEARQHDHQHRLHPGV